MYHIQYVCGNAVELQINVLCFEHFNILCMFAVKCINILFSDNGEPDS